MKRKTVQIYEASLIGVGISISLFFVSLGVYERVMDWTKSLEVELYEEYGRIAYSYTPFVHYCILSIVILILGGILLKRNTGLYGVMCCLPFATYIVYISIGTDVVREFVVATVGGMVVLYLAGSLSGRIFSLFDSPIPSQNWTVRSLQKEHACPGYYVIILGVLILLYIVATLCTVQLFTSYELLPFLFFLSGIISSTIGLILLRAEKLSGLWFFMVPYLGTAFFVHQHQESFVLLYYARPEYFIRFIGAALILCLVLALCMMNRKRLTSPSIMHGSCAGST